MENNLNEVNPMDDSLFEQINSSLADLKSNPEFHGRMSTLIDQVAQMNRIAHEIFKMTSERLNAHSTHLQSHDQHLEAHDKHLGVITQMMG